MSPLIPTLRVCSDAVQAFIFGRSGRWPAIERAHLLAFPTCAACGGKDRLQVHHVRPYHLEPALELDPDNLITLCQHPARLCHFRIGHCFDWSAFNPHVRNDAALSLKRVKMRHYE